MKSRPDFFVVFFGIGFANNWRYRSRKPDPDRHRNVNHRISQRHRSEFCTSELANHNVIYNPDHRMAKHPENDRVSQLDVLSKFFGINRKVHRKNFRAKVTYTVGYFVGKALLIQKIMLINIIKFY